MYTLEILSHTSNETVNVSNDLNKLELELLNLIDTLTSSSTLVLRETKSHKIIKKIFISPIM